MLRGCRRPVLVLISFLLVSCDEGFVDPGPEPSPAARDGGASISLSSHFEFLSPVDRSGASTDPADFDPNILSVVEVCRLQDGQCAAGTPLRSFTTSTGIEVNVQDALYQVNWKLNEPAALTAGLYRLSVRTGSSMQAGTHVFGHVDFAVGANSAVSFDGGDTYNATRTVPVKYRILRGALCETPDDSRSEPCFTDVLTNEGGTFINEAMEVGLRFEPNSLPEGYDAVTLVIERFESSEDAQCLPTPFPQYENCYLIKTVPELDANFAINPVLDICVDVAALPIIDQIDLYKFDGVDPSTLEFVPRSEPPFDYILTCDGEGGETQALAPAGWGSRLFAPVVAFFSPRPAYARRQLRRISPTYDPNSFSRFGFVRPLEISVVEGDDLAAVVGNPVAPSPTVRVTAAGNEVMDIEPRINVENVPVTFSTQGGATVSGGTSSTHALTDEDGLASTTWTLGSDVGAYTLTAEGRNPLGYVWPNLNLDAYTCDLSDAEDPGPFPYCEPAQPGDPDSHEKGDGPGAVWGGVAFTGTAVDVPQVAVRFLSPVEKGQGGGSTISEPRVRIRICKGAGDPCVPPSGGSVSVPELKNNFYQASWSTPASGPDVLGLYTIQVLVEGRMPPDGFVHVDAARNANSATTSYWFKPGQNVEIKFGLSAP